MPDDTRDGEDPITSLAATGSATYFVKWFAFNRYRLMESFLPQIDHVPGPDEHAVLKSRFHMATKHGLVVLWIRVLVTTLLVLAGGSTVVSTMLGLAETVPGARDVLSRVAAVASAAALILLVLRFALDRHLERVTLYLIFIGMQIAGDRRGPSVTGTGEASGDA